VQLAASYLGKHEIPCGRGDLDLALRWLRARVDASETVDRA
jgi:hypothetical protein